MRHFKSSPFGNIVDLDDPITYEYLGTDDVNKLNDIMLRAIGFAICYMDYWHKDIYATELSEPDLEMHEGIERDFNLSNIGYKQRLRVYALIENFTSNRRNNWGNPMWFKEQIFLFQNETENMC